MRSIRFSRSFLGVCTYFLTVAPPALGYDDAITHVDLARESVAKSVLSTSPTLLRSLGLRGIGDEQPFTSPTRAGERRLTEIVAEGAFVEDRFPRSLHHFYDPVYNVALTTLACQTFLCERSPDWALAARGRFASQQNSYADARQYLFEALTAPAATERNLAWGRTFATLGHVIHHLQDMAQPQHVRNDQHLTGMSTSRYEGYTAQFQQRARVRALAATATPVWQGDTATGLRTPRDFWTNLAGTGIAEFTNRNFVSQGANFRLNRAGTVVANARYAHPSPSSSTARTLQTLFGEIGSAIPEELRAHCGSNGAGCEIEFIGNGISEGLAPPAPGSVVNERASSLSIFDQDLRTNNIDVVALEYSGEVRIARALALNRFNHDAAHGFLIPRAVASSAGLMNFFFRNPLQLIGSRIDPDPASSYFLIGSQALLSGSDEQPSLPIHNAGTEEMSGHFTLYAIYDAGTNSERRQLISGNSSDSTVTIAAGTTRRLPITSPEGFSPTSTFMLVFRGRLGNEADAVMPLLFRVHHFELRQRDGSFRVAKRCDSGQWANLSVNQCDWFSVDHTISFKINRSLNHRQVKAIRIEQFDPWYSTAPAYSRTVYERAGSIDADPDEININIGEGVFAVQVDVELLDGERQKVPVFLFVSARSSAYGSGYSEEPFYYINHNWSIGFMHRPYSFVGTQDYKFNGISVGGLPIQEDFTFSCDTRITRSVYSDDSFLGRYDYLPGCQQYPKPRIPGVGYGDVPLPLPPGGFDALVPLPFEAVTRRVRSRASQKLSQLLFGDTGEYEVRLSGQ
jgi:hypothetical protein